MVYLGGKDQQTNEFISKELGKETIDLMKINKTKSRQGSTTFNDEILGRELMTIDELSKMPNSVCIVLIRGFPPFKTLKYRLEEHPRYEMLYEGDSTKHLEYPLNKIMVEKEKTILNLTHINKCDMKINTDDMLNPKWTLPEDGFNSYAELDKEWDSSDIVILEDIPIKIKGTSEAIYEETRAKDRPPEAAALDSMNASSSPL